MTISLDQYHLLQKKVDNLKRKADRAAGALESLMARLRKEFQCKTLKEAKDLLKELQRREIEAYSVYVRARKRFEKKWKHLLEDDHASDKDRVGKPARPMSKLRK